MLTPMPTAMPTVTLFPTGYARPAHARRLCAHRTRTPLLALTPTILLMRTPGSSTLCFPSLELVGRCFARQIRVPKSTKAYPPRHRPWLLWPNGLRECPVGCRNGVGMLKSAGARYLAPRARQPHVTGRVCSVCELLGTVFGPTMSRLCSGV
jgi:hypothetical protein